MALQAEKVYRGLVNTEPFPVNNWVEQLYHQARGVGDVNFIEPNLGPLLANESIINGQHLNSDSAKEVLRDLAQSVTASAIARLPEKQDQHGFRNCIDASKAKESTTDSVCRLTGYCYADHVDQQLKRNSLPDLQSLAADSAFVAAFKAKLEDPTTFNDEIMTDALNGNQAFSSTMLFMANYLQNGLSPPIHKVGDVWDHHYGDVAHTWLVLAADTEDHFNAIVTLIAKALPINYALMEGNDRFRPPSGQEVYHPIKAVQNPSIVAKADAMEVIDLGDWKTYTHMLDSMWTDKEGFYDSAISTAAQVNVAHYNPSPPFSGGNFEAPMPVSITNVLGQGVKDWISNARTKWSYFVTLDAPNNYSIDIPSPFGSCFVAGTQIITQGGDVSIENLQENDWVLTRGGFDEWGLVSDEKVQVPVDNPMIHGLNDDEPFFTAGHVFFTTTGLRALDPSLAMKENPWADIGRLSVGHVALRLQHNSTDYEHVPIQSISSIFRPDVKYVYGVHLREGRRSYHANRYKVAVNYPEITMKSICKALSMISQDQQSKALLALQELQPLFERFGISAMGEVLQKEMRTELDSGQSMRMYSVVENKLSSPVHATAAFYPEPIANIDYSGLRGQLPLVTIVEGVVSVYGDVCERARIGSDEIAWSRSMDDPNNTFEHGVISIDPFTLSGHGQIMYSRDEEGQDIIPTAPLQFLVVGTNSRAAVVSTTQQVITENSTSSTSAVTTASSVLAPSGDWILKSETMSITMDSGVTMELVQDQAVAIQVPQMMEVSALKEAAPEEIQQLKAAHFSLMAAADTAQPVHNGTTTINNDVADNTIPGKPVPIVPPMRFNMIYDEANYKDGQVAPTIATPFGPLDLVFGRVSAHGLAGMSLSLPDLDNLLVLINKLLDGKQKLQSLYTNAVGTVAVRQDPNYGNAMGTITLTPDALSTLDNLRDETEEYTTNWTFKKNLDTDISIPFVFSEIHLVFSNDRKTVMGTIAEYDSRSRTLAGKQHLFMSNPGDLAKPAAIDPRTSTSASAGHIPTGSPTSTGSTPQNEPVKPVRQGPLGPFHVQSIKNINYEDEAIQAKAKNILASVMYYHMAAMDREKIFNKHQLTGLANNLGKDLTGDLAKWVKETYGPAYTSLLIVQGYNTKDWLIKFTEKEKAKILYFWQGNGPKCLSQSPEYARINKICVREAMLQLYPILKQFIDDDGAKWAKDFFDAVIEQDMQNMEIQPMTDKQSLVNKYCNILFVLDPSHPYPQDLYREVRKNIYQKMFNLPAPTENMKEEPWMVKATEWLTNALTEDSNQHMDQELKELLLKEMADLSAARGESFDRTHKAHVAKQATEMIHVVTNMGKYMGSVKVLGTGLWLSTTAGAAGLKNTAIVQQTNFAKSGGKLMFAGQAVFLALSLASIFIQKPDLSASEIAKITGDTCKQVLGLIGPHLVVQEARSAAQIVVERQLINQKMVRKGIPGPLINESVENAMDLAAQEGLEIEKTAAKAGEKGGLWSRAKRRFSMSAKTLRVMTAILGAAIGAFLIWDLCMQWKNLTPAAHALSIIQIVIEFGIAILGVLEIFMAATVWIPVLGQILFFAGMIVAFALLIVGQPKPQPTAAEEFVKKMKEGWVKGLDDPPNALLEYSINLPPNTTAADVPVSVEIIAKNNTGVDIKLITPITSLDDASVSSTDSLASTKLDFHTGTDDPCLFSNASMWLNHNSGGKASEERKPLNAGEALFDRTEAHWKTRCFAPDGTNSRNTGWNFRVEFEQPTDATPVPVLKIGESFKMTIRGIVAKAGTTVLTVTEARPGAPSCLVVFTISRDEKNGVFTLVRQT